jgi:RNA methyltransferase, TrmH family
MNITSLQNPRVKHIVKLREKRQRDRDGLMLVEGFYDLEMALASGLKPQTIFIAPDLADEKLPAGVDTEILTVSRAVFEKMSYRDNPDGWLAVFPIPVHSLDSLVLSSSPFLILAESVEKPGNLGAILRTADAAGVDSLIVCDPRTDVYNPNVVRASRGTLFTVPTVQATNQEALDWLKSKNIKILAATPHTDFLYSDLDLSQPIVIAVGTEDVGLTDFWMQNADIQVKIPMMGKVNSLNVSTSTAILAYEVVRQRRKI